ncbi:uncharacterized protein LOC110446971 isoform X1 [Mizuhopecten yessoensis]|uniref:uncharacterized protein LOC110446971 isoform X1 n=1 Tax=Mizuhopecten yessoensis TaxID=6573 RepID=UPI000B45E0E3|nr:uncharacterized protein LOC110446971 isoform X1 [Mizuhopecten yessoensis]
MMDSTENERMSVLLSKYLELRCTGTQEEVDIKRKTYVTMGYFGSDEVISTFHGGSTAEGLTLLGSDVDIMIILKDVIVMYPDQCFPPNMAHKTILYARAADCRPGYVFLQLPQLQKRVHYLLTDALVRIEDSMFVSSDIFREHLVSSTGKQTGLKIESNGPACIEDTLTGGEDVVVCFPCHSWPKEANEWITRARLYGWPRQTLIDNIVHHGCHLVPVGDKCSNSENTFLQWRISFATAERSLVHSFSHIQFKVYTLLKYFLKQIKGILKETIGDDDILCSYFLKIVLFHAIENSNQLFWQEKNLFYCFWFCFKILIAFVRAGFCPNYFIPANNLFKRKVHGQHQQILLDVLSNHHQMKWKCLSVGNFFKPSIWEDLCNPSIQAQLVCPRTTQVTAYIHDRQRMDHLRQIIVSYQASWSELSVFRKAINSLSTSQSETDELFSFTYAIQHLHDLATEQVYPEHMVATDNKTRYRSLRKCKHWMIRKASIGTELLHLATFHFLTGNFFKTLEMCKQVMKLASCYFTKRGSHPEQKLKAMYSHVYHQFEHSSDRLKKVYSEILSFSKKGLYLPHLCQEILRTQIRMFIPPLPYALFLSFLCCHELGDTTGRDEALRLLIEVQSDNVQGGHRSWIVHTLLGICYQTLGDNHRAIKAYWDSAKSQADYQIWNPAIERIAVVYLCMYVSQKSDRG